MGVLPASGYACRTRRRVQLLRILLMLSVVLLRALWNARPVTGFVVRGQAQRASARCSRVAANAAGPLSKDEARIALFIDGDQLGPSSFRHILDAVQKEGELIRRRIYLAEHTAQKWESAILAHGLEPVVVSRVAGGKKDPVDLILSYDVGQCGDASVIAIASEDLDFAALLQRVRSHGQRAFAVVRSRQHASRSQLTFERVADKVITYGTPQTSSANPVRLVLLAGGKKASVLPLGRVLDVFQTDASQLDLADHPSLDTMWHQVRQTLTRLGYADSTRRSNLISAMAKFFVANELGDLTLLPARAGLAECYHALVAAGDVAAWAPSNEDLIYILPYRQPRAAFVRLHGKPIAQTFEAGGPFVMKVGPSLVEDILRRLHYLLPEEDVGEETFALFVELNIKWLSACNFVSTGDAARNLYSIFTSAHILQEWRVPPRDVGVKLELVRSGLLQSAAAESGMAKRAMQEFLHLHNASKLPSTYAGMVIAVRKILDAHHPTMRA